jgi:hypothetical protein
MAPALQPFWLYLLDLIPIPQPAPSTFYALRCLRSYDPTKSGWTSGNVLFIHLNIVHAIESRRYDDDVKESFLRTTQVDCGLLVFLWSWICTLHSCPVSPRSFVLFICLRIVASLLKEREVARISGALLD